MDEKQLLERLALIEALHAGAATPGERDAAAAARDRIQTRLKQLQSEERPIEYSFNMRDRWSHQLFVALLRRYDIKPYRYRRQRYTTVMARIPKAFVDETLWPQFTELNKVLHEYLGEVTQSVISRAIASNAGEVEERPEPAGLPPAQSTELE